MSTYLYYTQGILDFQEETTTYSEERLEIRLRRRKHRCPKCKSKDIMEDQQIFQRGPYYEFRGHLKKNCLGVLEKRMLGPNLFFLFPSTDAEAPNKGGMGALFQRGGLLLNISRFLSAGQRSPQRKFSGFLS